MKWCDYPGDNSGKGCLKWVCKCGHARGYHTFYAGCLQCERKKIKCPEFVYDNNDLCTLECMIYKKVKEFENKA